MRGLLLVGWCLVWLDSGAGAADDVRRNYEEARAKAGRDAAAHVQLALWCEQNGLNGERLEHLTKAVLIDPRHALARSLLGQVKEGESWLKSDVLAEKIAADARRAELLAEYNAKRADTAMTAHAQMLLALWCERKGLKPEALAHFTAVTRLNPGHEEAWRKLGCRKVDGRWLNEENALAYEREKTGQRQANRFWSARLANIKRKLAHRGQRQEAVAGLDAIRDPRAVPAIWYYLVLQGNEVEQRHAVNVLGHLDSQRAAQALALLAAMSPSAEVRRTAAESVLWRDRREYLDLWIGFIRKPLTYEVRPVGGPGSPGILYVEGERYNLQCVYELPRLPDNLADFLTINSNADAQRALMRRALGLDLTSQNVNSDVAAALGAAIANPGGAVAGLSAAVQRSQARPGLVFTGAAAIGDRDEQALQVAEQRIAQNQAAIAEAMTAPQRRLESDIAELDAVNAVNFQQTERILPFLETVSGQKYGHDPEAWTRWWTNELGYAYQSTPKPTIREVIPADSPILTPTVVTCSCFAAGTPVLTLKGPRSIESIKIGDQVLAQDLETGALTYQPVVAAVQNPPDLTLRLTLGAETIEATGIHRFWKAGAGWVMARDLAAGDLIRTIGGVARVAAIEPGAVQPVFNLEVARGRSFFVGNAGFLVHDYTLIETVDRPFDAITERLPAH